MFKLLFLIQNERDNQCICGVWGFFLRAFKKTTLCNYRHKGIITISHQAATNPVILMVLYFALYLTVKKVISSNNRTVMVLIHCAVQKALWHSWIKINVNQTVANSHFNIRKLYYVWVACFVNLFVFFPLQSVYLYQNYKICIL